MGFTIKEVLKYESLHNHLEKEIYVSISVAKHKIKEEIKKNSIPMDIKPKHIFNAVSQEMGLICPEYTYLFSNYHKNIFADGTFYAAPKFSYQLFIARTYVGEFNMFYTTSISLLKNKKQSTYYNVNNWNYYENIEHLTNKASESYNIYLNNIFPNKALFYKLIYILKEEENLSYNDYQRRTKGT
ncbi:hypothetical protein U3516DRAFT_804873 [Neocallimastix sp. 'constans']